MLQEPKSYWRPTKIWALNFFKFLLYTLIQNNFQFKKQEPSTISLLLATRIFSKAKTLNFFFYLSLDFWDNPIILFRPCIVLNNWSLKRKNATFETFPVGKQGWRIKGQMLRYLMLHPQFFSDLSGLSMCCISKQINWIISKVQRQINILVALSREIGDGSCFLYWKLFWIGVYNV